MVTPMKAVPAILAALALSACVAPSVDITDRSAMNASSTGAPGAETKAARSGQAFEGAWAGETSDGRIIEGKIERVNPDGSVKGMGCFRFANGGMRSSTLWKARLVSEDVLAMEDSTMRLEFRIIDSVRRRGEVIESGVSGNRRWTLVTPMRPMRRERCSHRFLDAPRTTPIGGVDDERPLIGAWSGRWPGTGNLAEVEFESIGSAGAVRGRYCTKWRIGGGMTLWDMDPKRGFKARLIHDGRAVRMTIPWSRQGRRMKNLLTFTLENEGGMELRFIGRAATREEKHIVVAMARGVEPDGCLAMTTRLPPRKRRASDAAANGR